MPSFGAIKLLQSRTGASRADCKRALEDHGDDQDAAAAALGEAALDERLATASGSSSGGGGGASSNQRALDDWASHEVAGSLSIIRVQDGDGTTFPRLGDTVTVHYRGTLQSDGTEFDCSYSRRPFTFRVGAGEVIRGWDEGLVKLSLGGAPAVGTCTCLR